MAVLLYHFYNNSLRNVTFIFIVTGQGLGILSAWVHIGTIDIMYNIIYYSRMNKFKRRRELC